MKIFKRSLILLLILLVGFVGYTLSSTGFFRTVEPMFEGEILQEIEIKGAEDMMVSREDSFVLISSTNRQAFPPREAETGGLYLIDLTADDYPLIHLTADFDKTFAPHGISWYKKDSVYLVMAINHTEAGHSLEVFELIDQELTHIRTMTDPSMLSPNDLVMIGENEFYYTNDHRYEEGIGRLAENYLGWAVSNVVHYSEGEYKEVADGIAYANGINYDRDRNLIFVASPRDFKVKVYDREEDGSLTFIEDIPCGTGVDNIEFDNEGAMWIGSHPNLLRFNAYSNGKLDTAPSEIIKITYQQRGDYAVEQIFTDSGERMSGCSVAVSWGDLIFTGNVMDDQMLVLKREGK